jgi:hypothetical protein
MSVQLESSQTAILDRVIQPVLADWPPAAAQAILALGFDETDRKRMASLLGLVDHQRLRLTDHELYGLTVTAVRG